MKAFSLVSGYQHFRRTCCLHFKVWNDINRWGCRQFNLRLGNTLLHSGHIDLQNLVSQPTRQQLQYSPLRQPQFYVILKCDSWHLYCNSKLLLYIISLFSHRTAKMYKMANMHYFSYKWSASTMIWSKEIKKNV